MPPNDEAEPTDSERLALARQFAANIASSLPAEVDARMFTLKSKMPFKVAYLREVLIHRVSELATVAVELYESNRLVPAFILTRAVVETVAMAYWLHEKVSEFMNSKDVDALDKFLMKAMMGSRDQTTQLESHNVMSAIDRLEKQFPSTRKLYENLCEFTHPNWSGTSGSYSKIDRKQVKVGLGANLGGPPLAFGLGPLLAGLAMFEVYYNQLGDLLLKLNEHFESAA
jgi:hypothetical protein